MEICTFEEYIFCCFCSSRIESTEYSGDTHRFFCITDHQVTVRKLTFYFIQSNELSSFGTSFYYNLTAFNLVSIETVHRLTICMKNVIGNIDNIVDRTYTDKTQFVLQPFGTFLYCYVLDSNTCITGTSFSVFYHNINVHIVIVDLECIYRRTFQCCLTSVLNQPCIQIACNAIVRAGIRTVRSNIYLQHVIALDIIIVFGKSSRYNIFRKYNDTFVACTDTDFVFSANHTVRLNAAKL